MLNRPIRHVFVFYKITLEILTSFEFMIIFLTAQTIIWVFALIFFLAENNINGSVNTYFDALWWSYCTITTVGYGDITPITFFGRIIAMMAMVVGTGIFITFLGLFTELLVENEHLIEIELFKRRRRKDD
jgi:voltage-gated potassium channel